MALKLPANFILASLVFGLGACAAPLDLPAKLADFDHQIFAQFQAPTTTVNWADGVGATHTAGELHAKPGSRLAEAWASGHAPAYGLTGQQSSQSVRELGFRYIHNRYQAYAKVLSPYPSRAWLITGDGEKVTLLARGDTRAWGEHAHFIELAIPWSVAAGETLRVHVTDMRGRNAIETKIDFEF